MDEVELPSPDISKRMTKKGVEKLWKEPKVLSLVIAINEEMGHVERLLDNERKLEQKLYRIKHIINNHSEMKALRYINTVLTHELRDGIPCHHPMCLSHRTHPCEGWGRIGGIDPI